MFALDNAYVDCRVSTGGAYGESGLLREGRGVGGGARGAHREDPTAAEVGVAGARVERTANMACMVEKVVTLEMSQLSGWLNSTADCRVEREACGKRSGMRSRATGGGVWRRRRRKQRVQGGPPTAEVVLAGHAQSAP